MFSRKVKRYLVFTPLVITLFVALFVGVANSRRYTSPEETIHIGKGGTFLIQVNGCIRGVAPWYQHDLEIEENETFTVMYKYQIPNIPTLGGGIERYIYVIRARETGNHEIAFEKKPRQSNYNRKPEESCYGNAYTFQLDVE